MSIKESLREWWCVFNSQNPSDIARECYKEFWNDESIWEYDKMDDGDRFIITVSNEYLDVKNDKFYTIEEIFELLNEQDREIERLKEILTEMLETGLQSDYIREEYCKGILRLFDRANSLNQAREMIREHLK